VGTTTTALNIALSLAMQGKAVVLAEMRSSFGTLSCHVRGTPKANLRNLLDLSADQIGIKELDGVLCQEQAGLRILYGPQHANEWKEIEFKQAQAIIKGLTQMVDTVVLDLPCHPSPATEAAIRLCSFIGVIVEREPGAVAAGKAMVAQLQQWGEGGGIIGAIVVNRTVYPVPMDFGEIQSGMGCPILGVVPWAATACLRAIREGAPLVIGQRENDAAFALSDIAQKIAANKLVAINL
jgi:MinD-like ATPase involved in chromosome partitioning or flagellar assembly